MREIGILMPLFSLPSDYGIGDMGEHASEWVNLLHKNNITIWQILPLNPVGYGNSPYQPYSSYAGDEIYLSLEELYQEGLLNKKPEPFMETADRVHYDAVRAYKEQYLREAYQNFKENQAYEAFISLEWVKPYAVYQALKKKKSWKMLE